MVSEGRLFKCPSCGSALSPQGDAAEIKCQYCGNTVIVPAELRAPTERPVMMQTTTPATGGSSILGIVAGLVVLLVVFGVVGLVLIGALSGGSQATPVAKALATQTPAGFAHVVLSFGGQGTAPGLFQDARHIAADADGNMYVDDHDTLRVQKFDPTGKYASGWSVDQSLCSNKSASLDTLAADRAGNVFVHFCGSVLKYDGATGKLLAQFNGDKNSPRDFYMDEVLYSDGGLLVLADGASANANEVLLRLDTNGKVLARYPNPVTDQSKRPASALTLEPAMDGLGNIFLLNKDDYAIYKYTPDGKYVNRFGSVGKGTGQFDTWAQHIAIDNQSRVYVTDFSGIKVFDYNGAYIESMSDRSIKGIQEMRINDKNEIYVVAGSSMIYKLALNKP
jgi:DNA-directed RNA polymerase subunit RPC12/RpoP